MIAIATASTGWTEAGFTASSSTVIASYSCWIGLASNLASTASTGWTMAGFMASQFEYTNSVCYEILAFSRANHFLTRLGYPLVRHMQKRFGRDSAAAMFRAVNSASPLPEIRQITG